jgi:hypothetical protein
MEDSSYEEVNQGTVDPLPKKNQKPRPKKETVGKPKLSKIFDVAAPAKKKKARRKKKQY